MCDVLLIIIITLMHKWSIEYCCRNLNATHQHYMELSSHNMDKLSMSSYCILQQFLYLCEVCRNVSDTDVFLCCMQLLGNGNVQLHCLITLCHLLPNHRYDNVHCLSNLYLTVCIYKI